MSESNLPTVAANGNLPATYEAAQKALAECFRADECKAWADKAAALASYAKQAKDDSLLRLAQRIQLRAVNRCGELLKQVAPSAGARTDLGRAPTRGSIAADAGLSEHQRKTALRVANVPRDEFEAAVESESPPSVTEMAVRGTVSRPTATAQSPIPADPTQVAAATSLLRQFAAYCGTHDPVSIACTDTLDTELMRNYVSTIDRWLDRFLTNLSANRAA